MKASDLFVRALEQEGVRHIFGIPGEENLDFLDSLRNSSIEMVITRHEQAAAFMAATYGRLTGKVGVCLSTLGPGATNFMTAAAYAQLGAMPLLMLTAQKPILKSKQGRFQIVDIVEMMRPLTKYTRQIVNGNLIPSVVREAIRIAEEERPGAVHLELPEDIAREQTDEPLFEIHPVRRPSPDPKALDAAIEAIQNAKHPLILIGAGANRKRTSAALSDLVDRTGIPFFNTQMGKGVLDERSPLFLGTASLSAHDYLHCAIGRADLIVNVGHDVVEKPPFFMHPGGAKVVHINFTPANIDEVYFPQVEVVGDIAASIQHLAASLKSGSNWDFSYYMKLKEEIDKHIAELCDDPRFPVIPQRIVADVRKAMPTDGIIALDNGVYKIWFSRNYQAHEPNTVLLDNALASMGAGLPSAMGAAMVHPNRPVMAICGDGGFMMNSQELETAVRRKLNLTVLVLQDNAYGMIKWKQAGMDLPPFSLEYGNPDFVKYAEAYGASGHRIEKTEDLVPILRHCLSAPGVHLVDLPVDYSENDRVLNKELKKLTCPLI